MGCKKTPSTMAGMYEGSVNACATPLSFRLVFPYRVCTALPEFSFIFGRNLGKWLFILFANKTLLVSGRVSEHRGGAGPRSTVAGSMDVAYWGWRETQGAELGALWALLFSLFILSSPGNSWGLGNSATHAFLP